MTKVSVICPFYNDSNTISTAIKSVQSQTYSDWELIIVDDHSREEEYIKLIKIVNGKKDDRISVIKTPKNSGPGVARNYGVDVCKGKMVTFLDADDEFYPDKILLLLSSIEKENADFVFGRTVKRFLREDKITDYRWAIERIESDPITISIRCFIDTISTIIRKDAFLKVGGFEPWYFGEDKYLYFKIASQGFKFSYCHECVSGVHNMPTGGSLSGMDKIRSAQLFNENIFLKMYDDLQTRGIISETHKRTISDKLIVDASRLFEMGLFNLSMIRYRQAKDIYHAIVPSGSNVYLYIYSKFGFIIAESARLTSHKIRNAKKRLFRQ